MTGVCKVKFNLERMDMSQRIAHTIDKPLGIFKIQTIDFMAVVPGSGYCNISKMPMIYRSEILIVNNKHTLRLATTSRKS
jgi:hypothetical protein